MMDYNITTLDEYKDLLLTRYKYKVLNNKVISWINDHIHTNFDSFIAYNNIKNKYLMIDYVPGQLYLMRIYVYNKTLRENIGYITVKVTKDKRIIAAETYLSVKNQNHEKND